MEKRLVSHKNWIGHEINESLTYYKGDVLDREIYCRKLHLVTEPLESDCCSCQCYTSLMQGHGHECIWEDITSEEHEVKHNDRYKEYERVDKLIKQGILKKLVSYNADEWIYEESADGRNRYLLGKRGTKTLLCCGVNPSTATPEKLDPTMKRVEAIAKKNGYDSYIMINLYPMRSTDPDGMHESVDWQIVRKNLNLIETVLSTGDFDIWAAWGKLIEKRAYLKDCLNEIFEITKVHNCKWFNCGETTKDGHPRHPLYLSTENELKEFLIDEYIKKL